MWRKWMVVTLCGLSVTGGWAQLATAADRPIREKSRSSGWQATAEQQLDDEEAAGAVALTESLLDAVGIPHANNESGGRSLLLLVILLVRAGVITP